MCENTYSCLCILLRPKFAQEVREELEEVSEGNIIRQPMLTDELPQDLRGASSVRIYKKGKRSEPGNYRLASLACIMC